MTGGDAVHVMIYGSCVSRDGVEFWAEHGLELTGYVARQTLISAYAPADLSRFRLDEITSAFQRRMAGYDIEGALARIVEEQRSVMDLLLWDLTDERLGVVKIPGGGWVSKVVPYHKGIFAGPGRLGETLRIGESEHLRAWKTAADRFLDDLGRLGLRERVVVNDTRWAVVDETGARMGPSGGLQPEQYNEIIERYLEHLAARGIVAIHVPQEVTVARSDHKWGPAPFHYVDTVYEHQATMLADLVAHAHRTAR